MVDFSRFVAPSTNLLFRFDREITEAQSKAINEKDASEIAKLTGPMSKFADWVCGTQKVAAIELAFKMAHSLSDTERLESAIALERLLGPGHQPNFKFEILDGRVAASVACPDGTRLAWTTLLPDGLTRLRDGIRAAQTATVVSELEPKSFGAASIELLPWAKSKADTKSEQRILDKLAGYGTFLEIQKHLDAQRREEINKRVQALKAAGVFDLVAGSGAQAPEPPTDNRFFTCHMQVRQTGNQDYLITYQAKAMNHDSPYSTYDVTLLLSEGKIHVLSAD